MSQQGKIKPTNKGERFPISSDSDVVKIREFGRTLASEVGFTKNDQTLIATSISEICRNIIEYADKGEVVIEQEVRNKKVGIIVKATDEGPGITNIEQALQEGYSTGRGMGVGLSGAKRIMDEFDIHSEKGKGTTVIMSKWINGHGY